MFCERARVLVLFVRRTGFKVGWEGLFKNNHAFIGSVCSKRSCHQGSSAFRLCPFKRLRRKISECIGALKQEIVRVRIYMRVCVCVCGSMREVGSVSVRFKGGGEGEKKMINNTLSLLCAWWIKSDTTHPFLPVELAGASDWVTKDPSAELAPCGDGEQERWQFKCLSDN